ncbi:NADH-quinone oxidoreductase subunit NuoN [Paracoccaceae bacterium]|nr:NADH-quinone oxidoreductase subunit NuoN [Paracoccaceae bacterium]
MLANLNFIIPELFLIIFNLSFLSIMLFVKSHAILSNGNKICAVALIIAAGLVHSTPVDPDPVINGFYTSNDFTAFFKMLVLFLSSVILYLSDAYLKKNNLLKYEFPLLINFSVFGMMIVISSNDLMTLYLGIEIQSLSLYIIAAYRRDNIKSTEAGLKYFILGALSSGLLLYGISLVYGATGTTQFDTIYEAIMYSERILGLQIGMVFLLSAIAFKFAAFPFHMWTPDVYDGSPTPVTAFMAIVPKLAIGAIFAKVLFDIFGGISDKWQLVLVFLSGGSMIIGAFGAIAQSNIKRLIGYSSIGHVGFALMGLAAVSPEGLSGFIIYLFLYSIMMLGIFAFMLNMEKDGVLVTDIYSLARYSEDNPATSFAFSLILFSLAGIPPLAGFICKLYVMMAIINSGVLYLALIGAIVSVVGAFYYLRIVYIVYFSESEGNINAKIPTGHLFVLFLSSAAIVIGTYNLLGVEPLTRAAAESLLY